MAQCNTLLGDIMAEFLQSIVKLKTSELLVRQFSVMLSLD